MQIVIYLHGFASGPLTNKAVYFKSKLKKYGISLIAPDLNVPSFRELSIQSMVQQIAETVKTNSELDITIIASSLSAIPLLHYLKEFADNTICIKRIILLAPCFNFFDSDLYRNEVSKNEALWKIEGSLSFNHFYYGRKEKLHYHFLTEISQYDATNLQTKIPVLIIHGIADEVVPFKYSEAFASKNQSSTVLKLIESGHTFEEEKDEIWNLILGFIGINNSIYIEKIKLDKEFDQFLGIKDQLLSLLNVSYGDEYLGDTFHLERITKEKGILYLAHPEKDGHKIVGAYYVQPSGKQTFLAIAPEHQKKGVGKVLVQSSYEDFAYLFGEVRNPDLKYLMTSLGFTPIKSFSGVIEKLGDKEKYIIEIRKTSDSVIYLRTNPRNKTIVYEAEILEKYI